ncbi:MAG: type II secretion system F family protein [Candidatus Dormibacteria bacterium]
MLTGAILVAAACFLLLQAITRRPAVQLPARGLVRRSTLSESELEVELDQARAPMELVVRRALLWLSRRAGRINLSLTDDDIRRAGLGGRLTAAEVAAAKLVLGALGLVLALLASLLVPPVLFLAPLLAWTGFVAPSVWLRERRDHRREEILRELADLIGLLKAFVSSGVSLEVALHLVSEQLTIANPSHVLGQATREALAAYGLGEPFEAALENMARGLAVDDLVMLVHAINQGRRLGTGLDAILREQEMLARLNQKNRAVAAASQVSTRLMGVLVGVYLPQFLCLVMIPLFWGIIIRAFG